MFVLHSHIASMPFFDVFFVLDQLDASVFFSVRINKALNLLRVIRGL